MRRMQPRSGSRERWQPLLDGFARLKTSWPRRGWSWDTRLSCISSSFGSDIEQTAHASAAEALPTTFDPRTIATAPPRVREVADRFGGVRAGQLLLLGGAVDGPLAFGLWWPWGDGVTISLRIGLVDVKDNDDPWVRVREVFSVSM
jgi:hypothetical protein